MGTEIETLCVEYPCSYDHSMQKALCQFAKGEEPRPLVVVLHTWSFGWDNAKNYLPFAKQVNWHLIGPDFRGSNTLGHSLSMGSDAAVQDVVDAVKWMQSQCQVDAQRIYLLGGSGGGYMALLMAARHPEIWAGVSAWCAISDLGAWCEFHQGKGYGAHIIANLQGDPRSDAAAAAEARRRSPLFALNNAMNVALDIATGIHDGHTGSVPISHTLNAFNAVVPEAERISQEVIETMTREERVPQGVPAPEKDEGYGNTPIHFRKTYHNTRVTIFEGGHTLLEDFAFAWLSQQRKGQKAVWTGVNGKGNGSELTR